MNDTTKEAPVPAPEPTKESKMMSFLASLGAGTIFIVMGLLLTETFGITDFYKRIAIPLAARTTTTPAAEVSPAKKPDTPIPPAETKPATVVADNQTPVACTKETPAVSVTQNCNCDKQEQKPVKRIVASKPRVEKPITQAPKAEVKETVVSTRPVSERIWLWHTPGATDQKPGPCIIERGEGVGLPPYCSSLKAIIPAREGDTEESWAMRITGDKKTGREHPLYQRKD